MKLKLKGRRFDTIEEIRDTDRKGLSGSVRKMEETTVGLVSKCGRELPQG
jgi:hypothetical protein